MVSKTMPCGAVITANNMDYLFAAIRQFNSLGTVPALVEIKYPEGHDDDRYTGPSAYLPSLKNPNAEIYVTFIDHDNVERNKKFGSRDEYKTWRMENQKRKKAALGTSDFRILKGHQDSNTKDQDLSDMLRMLMMKKQDEEFVEFQELARAGKCPVIG